MFERVLGDATMAAAYSSNFERMLEMAKTAKRSGKFIIEDPLFRQDLARSYIEVQVLKYHGLRNLSNQLGGGVPGPEGSIGKLLWSVPNQLIQERALNMLGMLGQVMGTSPLAMQNGFWQYGFLRSKANTIEAGTTEIQKNIIGERVLGLPKEGSRQARM
jgi:alkylation response protein AidB-like acyl-CoA dehydrogenase